MHDLRCRPRTLRWSARHLAAAAACRDRVHLTWNVQSRWLPSRKFSNRYEWQDAAEYDRVLSNPHYAAMNTVSCGAEIYAEIKALAGGATSVLGGLVEGRYTS